MRQIRMILAALALSAGIALTMQWVRNNTGLVLPSMAVGEAVQAVGAVVQGQEGFGEAVEVFSRSLWDGNDGAISVTAPSEIEKQHGD